MGSSMTFPHFLYSGAARQKEQCFPGWHPFCGAGGPPGDHLKGVHIVPKSPAGGYILYGMPLPMQFFCKKVP